MEYNELEKQIANQKIGQTLETVHTNLHLAKKEDRSENVKEENWTHDVNRARGDLSMKIHSLIEEKAEKFNEDNSFKEIKEIDPKRYSMYLNSILRYYNELGVLF